MNADPYDEEAFEAEIRQYEEDAAEWARWFDALDPEEKRKVYASMDAYVQECDDERRRQEAWLETRRAHNAERARTGLRKDGTPDRRFKRWAVAEVVGQPVAGRLFRGGYRSLESIRAASDDELLAVQNIGPKLVAEIRRRIDA